jgi:hypothetical protein
MLSGIIGVIPDAFLVPAGLVIGLNWRIVFPFAHRVADKITGISKEESLYQRKIFDDEITRPIQDLQQAGIKDPLNVLFGEMKIDT